MTTTREARGTDHAGEGLRPTDVAASFGTQHLLTPAWRECSLTRTAELESLLAQLVEDDPRLREHPLARAVMGHLNSARTAAHKGAGRWALLSGSLIERARSNIDAAEASLLRLSPPHFLRGQMPNLLHHVQRHLDPADPRRLEFERIAARLQINQAPAGDAPAPPPESELSEDDRSRIIGAVRAASSESLREQQRVRSFRNVLMLTAAAMSVIAAGFAVIGFVAPQTVPLCFHLEQSGGTVIVCPTDQSELPFTNGGAGPTTAAIDAAIRNTAQRQDLLVVEVIGLAAAAVSAAAALRVLRGSSEPYGLPVALALLKLPLGAMTALLGLLLMRGQFVPGLSALDTSAQIIAWALVFGYAQQLFTQLIDRQANTVLGGVRGTGARPEAGGR
jgi:hypothetical protein